LYTVYIQYKNYNHTCKSAVEDECHVITTHVIQQFVVVLDTRKYTKSKDNKTPGRSVFRWNPRWRPRWSPMPTPGGVHVRGRRVRECRRGRDNDTSPARNITPRGGHDNAACPLPCSLSYRYSLHTYKTQEHCCDHHILFACMIHAWLHISS
jgi:hypothetical protein